MNNSSSFSLLVVFLAIQSEWSRYNLFEMLRRGRDNGGLKWSMKPFLGRLDSVSNLDK